MFKFFSKHKINIAHKGDLATNKDCINLHGHEIEVTFTFKNNIAGGNTNYHFDISSIRQVIDGIIANIDNKILDNLESFQITNSSFENIAVYLCNLARERFATGQYQISVQLYDVNQHWGISYPDETVPNGPTF